MIIWFYIYIMLLYILFVYAVMIGLAVIWIIEWYNHPRSYELQTSKRARRGKYVVRDDDDTYDRLILDEVCTSYTPLFCDKYIHV